MVFGRKQRISLFLFVALMVCLSQGTASKISNSDDPNCKEFNSKGKCIQCCDRYYYNQETCLCTRVSELCQTYDLISGKCLTCYYGYGYPINGVCSSTPVEEDPQKGCSHNECDESGCGENCCGDEQCQSKEGSCKQCQHKEGQHKQCKECQHKQNDKWKHNKFDFNCKCRNEDKVCISCFKGYVLNQDKVCIEVKEVDQEVCDHCVEYKYVDKKGKYHQSWKYGCSLICTECEDGYYLDCDNKCQPLPENCEQVDEKGKCTQCEEGYQFDEDGVCVQISDDQVDHCAEYWWVSSKGKWYSKWRSGCKKVCKKCNQGYYLNDDNECVQYPPHCTQVNENGDCKCCASGYKLDSYHDCVEIIVQVPDDNCAKYVYMNDKGSKFSKWTYGCKKVCKQCDDGYYLDKDYKCVELPEYCVAANKYGDCTKCKKYYELDSEGNCVPVSEGPADDHCAVYQYLDNKGSSYKKWFKGCKQVCKVCDEDYILDNNGKCVLGPDMLCVKTNIDGTCDVCSFRSIRGKLGRCIKVNEQCKDWDKTTALCTDCYGGYKLVKGCCVVA